MSGFAPDPGTVARIATDNARVAAGYRMALEQIASGSLPGVKAQVIAKVALGELPIEALLGREDSEVFCMKCQNKGRTVRGQGANAGQRFGCSGCGYLEGEHPQYPAMRGAT